MGFNNQRGEAGDRSNGVQTLDLPDLTPSSHLPPTFVCTHLSIPLGELGNTLQCHHRNSTINTQLERGPGKSHTFLPEVIDAASSRILVNKASHMITLNYHVFRKRRDGNTW